jgi:hypothetical protein
MNIQETLPTRSGPPISNDQYNAFRLQRAVDETAVAPVAGGPLLRLSLSEANAAPAVFVIGSGVAPVIDNGYRMFDQYVERWSRNMCGAFESER